MSKHYPPEQRERVVKAVLDHLGGWPSRCGGGCCRPRTIPLRGSGHLWWGAPIKDLKREVRDLKRLT